MIDFSKFKNRSLPVDEFTKPKEHSKHQQTYTDLPGFFRKSLTLHLYYTEYIKMDPSVLSNFDPSLFLDATVEQASTARPLLPAGRDVICTLGEPKMTAWSNKEKTSAGLKALVPHEFIVAQLPADIQAMFAAKDGMPAIEKFIIMGDIMLDTIDNGQGIPILDMAPGKNGRLRQYREATGLNEPGRPFSVRMLQGHSVRVKITHEPYNNVNYDKIGAVAKV